MPNDKENRDDASPGGFVFPDNTLVRNMDTSTTRDLLLGESTQFSKGASERTEEANSKEGKSEESD